ncbi:MAG TPA: nucleoside phosphorylase [Egibacteraceae bacterium]|jgi:uridine phosphorylase|nr:nucleoside phosphorylase [Egibacteraceae bacterium]
MAFPNFADKHAGRPLVTPQRILRYRSDNGIAIDRMPRAVMVSWQRRLLDRVKASRPVRQTSGPAGAVLELSPTVGFAHLPIGAPAVGIVVEELCAAGVEVVVGIGTAGGLAAHLHPGDTVLCSAALRDDGTSHHYAPPQPWAEPDQALFEQLRAVLPRATVGRTWTTDAPYWETAEEIAHYRAAGVVTVEMEAAALFTVSRVLGARAASVFCVSDVLHGVEWEPHFHAATVADTLWDIFESVEAALDLPTWRC